MNATAPVSSPSLGHWLIATRPWSFPASSMPALVTFVYVFYLSRHDALDVNWLLGVLAIIGAVVFQISGNLISDYFDYTRGIDREDTFGSSRLLVNQTFRPRTILRYGIGFIIFGAFLGLYLVSQTGGPLLIIGFLGFVGAAFYYQFKSRALGDALIFLVYGPLISVGVFYVMTGLLDWRIVALSLPIAFITVNILHANNTRDMAHDKRADIKTFAMLLGVRRSVFSYKLHVFLTYLLMAALVIAGILPWVTLCVFLTLPLAIGNCRAMEQAREEQPENIRDLDVRTAKLQLAFSVLLSALLFVSAWL
ncbi:MAG: prenyltransferase [Burkholderiales bacterium]|jgi:1,4-dihydroxy-2-naphthoate octaprenyltransferase|nr:prenyltransferase [Burkholderiales bacterium]